MRAHQVAYHQVAIKEWLTAVQPTALERKVGVGYFNNNDANNNFDKKKAFVQEHVAQTPRALPRTTPRPSPKRSLTHTHTRNITYVQTN